MTKVKIAISLDKGILENVDAKVDRKFLQSRSQAIEFYLRKGLMEHSVDTAVILMKGSQCSFLLKKIDAKPLILCQLDFFLQNGIQKVMLVTQENGFLNEIKNETESHKLTLEIMTTKGVGNAQALFSIRHTLHGS